MINKSILITGCSSGIGLCAALQLQERGYTVVASVRKQEDIARLQANGLQHVIQLDLACSESISCAVSQCLDITGGRLYAVFNNGSYGQPGAVEDLSRDTLRKQFETNVLGVHELTIKLLPVLLQEPSARIVQNSSVLGFSAMPMRGAYNASKFALEGLTDTLRLELHGSGVKVSLIEPGPILSHFRKNALLALKENIQFENSRFGLQYEAALQRLSKEGAAVPFTLGPEAVVKKLIHALESKRPKIRYYVTFPTHLFAVLRHILPYRILDKVILWAAKA